MLYRSGRRALGERRRCEWALVRVLSVDFVIVLTFFFVQVLFDFTTNLTPNASQ
jgi:hypothetical protein